MSAFTQHSESYLVGAIVLFSVIRLYECGGPVWEDETRSCRIAIACAAKSSGAPLSIVFVSFAMELAKMKLPRGALLSLPPQRGNWCPTLRAISRCRRSNRSVFGNPVIRVRQSYSGGRDTRLAHCHSMCRGAYVSALCRHNPLGSALRDKVSDSALILWPSLETGGETEGLIVDCSRRHEVGACAVRPPPAGFLEHTHRMRISEPLALYPYPWPLD